MDCSKGRKPVAYGGMWAGVSGVPECLDPVRDCRCPRRNTSLFNGLIDSLHRRVKTGFRFASPIAAGGGYGSNLDTPDQFGSGGQAFHMSSCPACPETLGGLEVRFRRDDGCNPAVLPSGQRPPTGESLLWKERQKRTRSRR